MANKNSEWFNSMTPFCKFNYLYLAKPDTKYEPKYSVDLLFDPEKNPEHAEFVDKLNALNEKVGEELISGIKRRAKEYRIKSLFREQEDANGEPTGILILKATSQKKPVVKDAEKKVIPDDIVGTFYSGTVGRCVLSLRKSIVESRKTCGLAVYLQRVQVIEPVTCGDDSGDFSVVEGGFSVRTTDNGDESAPDF